jgi:hypothetical protein
MSSGMLRCVTLVRTDVSEELSASFIRMTRIGELGTTSAVAGNRLKLRYFFFKSEDECVESISRHGSNWNTGCGPNCIIRSKSNFTSSHESTDCTTDSTHIHVKGKDKHKSNRYFTPKQQTIMQQPGRWTPLRRLQLVQWWRYQRIWTTSDRKETEWQTVSNKRKRISRQKSAETAKQINTAYRYESLSRTHCDDDITGNVSETEPNPPHQSTYTVSRTIKLWLETLPKLSTKKPTSPKHCLTTQ